MLDAGDGRRGVHVQWTGVALLVAAQLALWVWNASELSRHVDAYATDPLGTVFVVLRGVALAGALVAWLAVAIRARSLRVGGRQWLHLTLCAALGLAVATLVQPLLPEADPRWLTRALFFGALAVAQAASLGALLRGSSGAPAGVRVRGMEVVAFNVVVSLILLEGIAAVAAHYWPSALLSGPDLPVRIAAVRDTPGRLHFGTPLNSGGYADDEFFVAGPEDLVVALHSDSFGIGVVPQRYNFASVAESRLREAVGDRFARVALHSFGVPGVSLNVHRYVYETQAAPLRPALVVLGVFVGNDILEGYTFGTPLIERYRLQEWYVWSVVGKLLRLARTAPGELAAIEAIGQGGAEAASAEVAFPVADDPALEAPTFSEETFASIEQGRIEVTNPDRGSVERRYRSFFRGLEYFHDRLGERLLVVIIPDEFQVNDALYETLARARPGIRAYPRDLPQQRIAAFCEARGAHCLDLLPVLRAAEASGRTYHLRDTHWNARGNRVAGEALAAALAPLAEAVAAAR